MANFLLRLPDELYTKLRNRAHEEHRPMSKIVREAIAKELEQDWTPVRTGKVPEQGGEPPPTRPPAEVPDPLMLHCPVMGCEFQATSGSAMCPRHGRKVV